MNMIRLILSVLFVFTGNFSRAQKIDFSTRDIIVNSTDSVVKVSIWNKPVKVKIRPEYNYYWYYAGIINHNVGDYSGKLLHGKYEVFDNEQKLMVKGTYEYGLMTGTWNRWYSNGNLQWTGNYKKGYVHGDVKTYYGNGKPSSTLSFRHGQLNGKSYFYLKDTTITKKFKDGKEIVKVKKIKVKTTKQKGKAKVDDSKKDPDKKSSDKKDIKTQPQNNKSTTIPENKSNKKWWKFSLFKRKNKESKEDLKKNPVKK